MFYLSSKKIQTFSRPRLNFSKPTPGADVAHPPWRAPPVGYHIDYADTQIPSCDDYNVDPEYPILVLGLFAGPRTTAQPKTAICCDRLLLDTQGQIPYTQFTQKRVLIKIKYSIWGLKSFRRHSHERNRGCRFLGQI